jgi:hypothetical protein
VPKVCEYIKSGYTFGQRHGVLSHGGHLEKPYYLCPLSLAFEEFSIEVKGAEQLILFSWD